MCAPAPPPARPPAILLTTVKWDSQHLPLTAGVMKPVPTTAPRTRTHSQPKDLLVIFGAQRDLVGTTGNSFCHRPEPCDSNLSCTFLSQQPEVSMPVLDSEREVKLRLLYRRFGFKFGEVTVAVTDYSRLQWIWRVEVAVTLADGSESSSPRPLRLALSLTRRLPTTACRRDSYCPAGPAAGHCAGRVTVTKRWLTTWSTSPGEESVKLWLRNAERGT